jgi:hypothetical protein
MASSEPRGPRPGFPPDSPVRCHGCRHFLVTHQADWPYACRAYGLRSRMLPSAEILAMSGQPCQQREPRPPPR